MKSTTTQPYGLLHPLPVPDNPWDVVGIDFVGLLPELHTHTGLYDMICVIIDHFTHMVHLVPTVQMYCAVTLLSYVQTCLQVPWPPSSYHQ